MMKRLCSAGYRHFVMLLALGALMLLPAVLSADCGDSHSAMKTTSAMSASDSDSLSLADDTMKNLTVRLTSDGIIKDAVSMDGGLFIVTVRNDTSSPRGIKMTGHDLAGTPYVRYTKVLMPGQSQSFRWYFPDDTSANVVDLLRCEYAARTCAIANTGNMKTSITFS